MRSLSPPWRRSLRLHYSTLRPLGEAQLPTMPSPHDSLLLLTRRPTRRRTWATTTRTTTRTTTFLGDRGGTRRFFTPTSLSSSSPLEFPASLLRRYEPTNKLGEGAFADVFQANVVDETLRKKYQTDKVAIKCMNRQRNAYAMLECELLGSVHHVNVLRMFDVITDDTDYVFLVTELLKGPELFEVLIDRDEPFPESTVLMFAEQMLGAIEACHLRNFAHLDVKIENMVFREPDSLEAELVLVDFGAADRFVRAPYADKSQHYIEGLDDETRPLSARPAGTIPYSSPEVMNGFFSSRSDVWSVGVCLFVLLTGRRPFESLKPLPLEAEKSVVRQIRDHGGNRTMKPAVGLEIPPDVASPETVAFLRRLTAGHPGERYSATEALQVLRQLPNYVTKKAKKTKSGDGS